MSTVPCACPFRDGVCCPPISPDGTPTGVRVHSPAAGTISMVESKRPGQYFPIEETDEGTYIFNAKDLCMIDHLAGTAGRRRGQPEDRGTEQVGLLCGSCDQRLPCGAGCRNGWKAGTGMGAGEVVQVSHREYCTGFFYGRENACSALSPTAVMCGIVMSWPW